MSQDVRMISSKRIQVNNSLHIWRNFFFSIDFIHNQYRPLFVLSQHHVCQVLDPKYYTSATITTALANDKPVTQVSKLPYFGLNFVQNHRKTEE